jgi:hypothetical protein
MLKLTYGHLEVNNIFPAATLPGSQGKGQTGSERKRGGKREGGMEGE